MSRLVFLLALFFVLLLPVYAHGQIVINEIMYDLDGSDSKREWIEVYNNSDNPIDLSTWKLFEGDTNHRLKAASGDGVITPYAYAIIADDTSVFQDEHASFSGILFDSSFSLSNSGEVFIFRDSELNDVDAVSYISELGAAGDGNSLQRIDGGWKPSKPTPGSLNVYVRPAPTPTKQAEAVRNPATKEAVAEVGPVNIDLADLATGTQAVAAVTGPEKPPKTLLWLGIMAFAVLLGVVTVLLVNHKEKGTIRIIEEHDD